MSEYVRGERLRKFCDQNKLFVHQSFDESRNKKVFEFMGVNLEGATIGFIIELDASRYVARGEQAEIELVHVASRKLNQILNPDEGRWYE